MCGIAAWAGENPKHFNKYKFDILGIFNDSRGGDSCGISTDGEIYYGLTTSDKKYKDFLVEKNYLVPKKIPIVIAHTRKSSVGTINTHNAHPFGFGINEKYDSFEFIGCHNGTLYNYEELAREFNVSVNDNDSNGVFKRRKIDSEVFLEIIYKNQNFKVLSKYNGGAAIVFYNTLEPNVLYAFHGESSTYSNTKPEEERPLFYYQEKSNSVYISSIAESLVAIGGELNKNVFSFKTNCVYKIKNGNVDKAELFEISRNNVFSKKPYTSSSFCGYGNTFASDFDESDYYTETQRTNIKQRENANALTARIIEKSVPKIKEDINNIYEEISEKGPDGIMFNKLRYSRNGHEITGIYTYIDNHGFVKITEKYDQNTTSLFSNLIGKTFDHTDNKFMIISEIKNAMHKYSTPFPIGKTAPMIYFYKGVMLQSTVDYLALIESRVDDSWYNLSKCSKHPVCNSQITICSKNAQRILLDDKEYTGNISPLGTNKIYNIVEGRLKSITYINKEEEIENNKILIPLTSEVKEKEPENNTQIKLFEAGFSETSTKIIVDFLEADEIDETIDDKSLEEETEDELFLTTKIIEAVDTALANILDETLSSKSELLKLNIKNQKLTNGIKFLKEIEDNIEEYYQTELNINLNN